MPWSTTRANQPPMQVRTQSLKAFRKSNGVERHLYVDTTDEDCVVCIHDHSCERLSRGERDGIWGFKSCVCDTCVDDEALVAILFPDGKSSTVLTGLLSK